ncbi:serine/threonine protein kinase [filamentous cyanobacterium LEGE 11480]|uniref:Serine/threonine protein kinase n=1 Tax=Romeriopsis navalis LEGE 11480 TaxID=2777977 RepID=A0A928Z2F3_9CYAN|nr:serine/threonine-protein kinase [Romeriopsis navalis]MBE9028340.1 serine/threonine protein kinase [Romeriopsis navalis LEGE 11480]
MLQTSEVLQGRYRLVRPLGENEQRQTWLAIDEAVQPESQVVVKLLSFANAVDWQLLKLFEREASILQQLDHPCIPAYRDYFSIEDSQMWFGLVEAYIPGKTLKELLESSRRFTEAEIRRIAVEVLEILQYLHQLSPPIYHRDIKPSNLIWGDDDRIHLVDFGGVQDKAPALGSTFTVVGTYGYTPIEQFGGRTIPASDLYALGATLVHLLTGVCPADLPQKNLRFDFEPLVNVSPALVKWLQNLIEPDAQNRFQQAETALQSLDRQNLAASQTAASNVETSLAMPPLDTKIRFRTSSTELIIEIPPPVEVSQPVAWVGVGALALLFITMPPLAIVAGVILATSMSASSNWALRCYGERLTLYRKCPGLPQISWGHQSLPIQSIQDVVHHNLMFSSGKSDRHSRVMTIRTASQELVFGRSLTLAEGNWLVSELKAWLKL